jgi:hypothetical protein
MSGAKVVSVIRSLCALTGRRGSVAVSRCQEQRSSASAHAQLLACLFVQILHVEQEVVGDDRTVLQAVLDCDSERAALLKVGRSALIWGAVTGSGVGRNVTGLRERLCEHALMQLQLWTRTLLRTACGSSDKADRSACQRFMQEEQKLLALANAAEPPTAAGSSPLPNGTAHEAPASKQSRSRMPAATNGTAGSGSSSSTSSTAAPTAAAASAPSHKQQTVRPLPADGTAQPNGALDPATRLTQVPNSCNAQILKGFPWHCLYFLANPSYVELLPASSAHADYLSSNAPHEARRSSACLNPEQVYQRLEEIDAYTAEARASAILAGLSFDTAAQGRATKTFSGGWRMRVALAR